MFNKKSRTVKTETVMPNGKHYFGIEEYDMTYKSGDIIYYLREENGKVYRYAPFSECTPDSEYVYYDFTKSDKEVWPVCSFNNEYMGVDTSFEDHNEWFNKDFKVKAFWQAGYDNGNLVWGPRVVDGGGPEYFYVGLGLWKTFVAFDGDYVLTGAIINGNKMGVITGINSEDKTPEKYYSLSNNYPNPFDPSTEISYTIEKSGFVKLTVFDILGKEVAKLVNEPKASGVYKVTFNAANIPSGVYFYSLDINGFSSVKKMVILK